MPWLEYKNERVSDFYADFARALGRRCPLKKISCYCNSSDYPDVVAGVYAATMTFRHYCRGDKVGYEELVDKELTALYYEGANFVIGEATKIAHEVMRLLLKKERKS